MHGLGEGAEGWNGLGWVSTIQSIKISEKEKENE